MPAILKHLKRKWRQTDTRRVLRGKFGPSKNTIKHVKAALIKKRTALAQTLSGGQSSNLAKLMTGLTAFSAKSEPEAQITARIAAKYSLDAMNVKEKEKRSKVFGITVELVETSMRGNAPLNKVSEYISVELSKVLGKNKDRFINYFGKKINSMKK